MNYYERHLGDYARDTGHLSILEHGAYTLLLDRYYATEAGIPAAQVHRLARARSQEEIAAVDAVLADFFELRGGAWINRRAEEEIEKAHVRIEAAKENGKRGGRPRKNPEETQQKPSGLSLGSETKPSRNPTPNPAETQVEAHQTPDTKHQTPGKEKKPRHPGFDALAHLQSLGVSEGVAADWIALRKGKGAKVSETAIAEFRKEADKAGLSMHDTLAMCCMRGWQGFKAEWVQGQQQARASPAQDRREAGIQWANELMGRSGPNDRHERAEVFDAGTGQFCLPADPR